MQIMHVMQMMHDCKGDSQYNVQKLKCQNEGEAVFKPFSTFWNCRMTMCSNVVKQQIYIGWNDVTYLWSQYDRHFVGQDRRTVRS